MAIASSYFQSNSLSGAATVTNGQVRVYLPTNFYALEGNKTFIVKLRRGSIVGTVACVSPTITLQDSTSLDGITANVASVNEGGIVKFDIATTGVANGYPVYYSVEPKAANLTVNDFYNKSNTGVVYILNNQANITLQANTDSSTVNEDGEAFALQLRSFSTTGPVIGTSANVTIIDLFKTEYYASVINANAYSEQGVITFTASLNNYRGLGKTKYYYTIGNVTASNFVSGNTGTINFTANGGSNIFVLQLANNIPTDEERTVQFAISDYPSSTPNAISNSAYIYDLNFYNLQATGGTVQSITDGANTYKMHTFTTSGTFTITKNPLVPIEYFVVAGGGSGGGSPTVPGGFGYFGGGGGAGGVLLGNTAVSVNTYTVTVGAGAAQANTSPGGRGGDGLSSSITAPGFSTITTVGGGGGGFSTVPRGYSTGNPGGSGGGNSGYNNSSTPSGTVGQGNNGGLGGIYGAGGGGGAGAAGGQGAAASNAPGIPMGGTGGNGIPVSWIPSSYGVSGPAPGRWFGGGGGGDGTQPGQGALKGEGGAGGGGAGAPNPSFTPDDIATAGGINTGGGGGGSSALNSGIGGKGGSGIVIIRYKYPYPY